MSWTFSPNITAGLNTHLSNLENRKWYKSSTGALFVRFDTVILRIENNLFTVLPISGWDAGYPVYKLVDGTLEINLKFLL